jgi:hypothetical protein
MINALERRERAAHRGDRDTLFFIFSIASIGHVCLLIEAEYLSPSDNPYPPCDVTRIISKHKDTRYGQKQYVMEWASKHLTE